MFVRQSFNLYRCITSNGCTRRSKLVTAYCGTSYRAFASGFKLNELTMPALSPTMESGNLAAWKKKEGDLLQPGDVLCEVETDKATVDYEVQDEMVLAKTVVTAGTTDVQVGALLAYTVEDLEQYEEFVKSGRKIPELSRSDVSDSPTSKVETTSQSLRPPRTPLIKFLGKRSLLVSTSDKISTKAPVIESKLAEPVTYADKAPSQSTPKSDKPDVNIDASEDYVDIKLTNMRKVIAKRLASSKATVPHNYVSIDCEIDSLMQFRKTLKSKHGINVSVNDFILKSVALALRDVPAANCSWNPTKNVIEKNSSIDISVAVATEAGLITPIVKNVDSKGLSSINSDFKDLVSRARSNKLKPEEFQGGSFTVSNLGSFGIDSFTAVINPPQGCILAIGGGRKTLVHPKFDVDNESSDEEPRIATMMNVTLSSDRRILEDAAAAQFLQVFKTYIDNPELLVL